MKTNPSPSFRVLLVFLALVILTSLWLGAGLSRSEAAELNPKEKAGNESLHAEGAATAIAKPPAPPSEPRPSKEAPEWLNTLHPAVYGMLGVLLGSIISTIGTIVISHNTKKSEERKNIRELAVKWGIEAWRLNFEGQKLGKGMICMHPVEDFILHALLMSDSVFKANKLTVDEFVNAMRENSAYSERISAERVKDRPPPPGRESPGQG